MLDEERYPIRLFLFYSKLARCFFLRVAMLGEEEMKLRLQTMMTHRKRLFCLCVCVYVCVCVFLCITCTSYLSLVRRGRFVTNDCSKLVLLPWEGEGVTKKSRLFLVDFCWLFFNRLDDVRRRFRLLVAGVEANIFIIFLNFLGLDFHVWEDAISYSRVRRVVWEN